MQSFFLNHLPAIVVSQQSEKFLVNLLKDTPNDGTTTSINEIIAQGRGDFHLSYKGQIISVAYNCVDNYLLCDEKKLTDKNWMFFQNSCLFPSVSGRDESDSLLRLTYFSFQNTAINPKQIIPNQFLDSSYFIDKTVRLLTSYMNGEIRRVYIENFDARIGIIGRHIDTKQKVECYYLRDIFKNIFEEIGVELEYSGKQSHERGVIVDYKDDLESYPHIRLGNTVLKSLEDNKLFATSIFLLSEEVLELPQLIQKIASLLR